MPSKNVVKQYGEERYYHVYNRGVNRGIIYKDRQDYAVFLNLLKRYLGKESRYDVRGRVYDSYSDRIELLSFCLMPNHFHLLLYLEKDKQAISELMRKLLGSYTTYFNKRHERVGHLFQGVFKASNITNDVYLQHITRYIHLNPRNYETWEYSSLPYYRGSLNSDWVSPKRILDLFDGVSSYDEFISDYYDYKNSIEIIENELANSV